MSLPSSGYATTAAVAASQTAAKVVQGLASPRAILLRRLCYVVRMCAIVNPLALLVFDLVFFEDACPRVRNACSLLWHVTIVSALVALVWTAAVCVSFVRMIRGRKPIPYMVHANLATIVAVISTVCFGIVVSQMAQARYGEMPWWGKASLLGLSASLMLLGWNEFAWAIWGWKWLRRHKLEGL